MFNEKEYRKNYYKKNKPKLLLMHKKWRKENKEKLKKQKHEYYKKNYEKNRDKILEKAKEYRKNNKDKRRNTSKNYYEKNRDKIRKYRKKHRQQNIKEYNYRINEWKKKKVKTDKNFRLRIRLRERLRKALKDYSKNGKIRKAQDYSINYEKIIEYLKPLPKNLEKYDIHHIKPLFNFNLDDEEQIKQAFHPKNHKLILRTKHRKINHKNN